MSSTRDQAWAHFDHIVDVAPLRDSSPWRPGASGPAFEPDYDTLQLLLGVPLLLRAASQSGVPALALDVWVSYELRRAGFESDWVWPRPVAPRVLPREVLQFIDALPKADRKRLRQVVSTRGTGGSSAANLLGKNYVKQVDVVMSSWATGPELLISTKRMDSSFGKNAANRVEESYGDAKNLRLRHPRAALGFMYSLGSLALVDEPAQAAWLMDLLAKLGREDDAYDAVGLIIPEIPLGAPPGDDVTEPAGPLEAGAEVEPPPAGVVPVLSPDLGEVPRVRAVTLLDDVSVADWIFPRLTGEPGSVAGTVPTGFAAYARILHPVDGDGRVRTWAEIATTTGRVVHPEVQWHALIGAPDPWNREGWHEGEPQQANLALPQLLALCDTLAGHTSTPGDCFFALWEGWAQLNAGARSMMVMEAGRGRPKRWLRRRRRGTPVPPVIEPKAFRAAPRVRLPDRDHLLFRGALTAMDEFVHYDRPRTPFTQSPQLLWPADRAWFVASEIDFACTLVGGSAAAVEAILTSPALEALRLTGAESLRYDADHVNR